MPAQGNANVIAIQLEKVRDKIPLLYERDDILLTMIQKRGDAETVSSRNMRLPLQLKGGGKPQSVSVDGGDYGRGSGTLYDVAQVTPVFFNISLEITKLVEYATNAREKAIENAVKREVSNGMKQFRAFLDRLMQTNGNGVLGTIASVAGNVITMNVPNGASLVDYDYPIEVWNAALTVKRGTCNVLAFDAIYAKSITVDALPGGTIATDVIVHQNAVTVGSLFGIKYHQSNATTGTWLGLNRPAYPEQLRTPRVNGGNAALTPGMVRQAFNFVKLALGVGALSDGGAGGKPAKLVGYVNVQQSHAWENTGIVVSQVIKEGGGGRAQDIDMLFSGQKTMGGVPLKEGIHADQTRVEFLDLSHWGRAVMKDIDYVDFGGDTIWPIYGASGAPSATMWFAYETGFQVWDDSPRSGAFIDTLALPPGY